MKVTKEQPKKLVYDLPNELEYSKDGGFIKTEKLYIKEFVYGELQELSEKFDDFLDEFEKCREKGVSAFLIENEDNLKKLAEDEKLKNEAEIQTKKLGKDLELMSANYCIFAKRGGLSTSYLKKTLLPFLTNYIYCDQEMSIKITESNFKKLGLAQRGLLDFFLLGGLLPCYISLSIKQKEIKKLEK